MPVIRGVKERGSTVVSSTPRWWSAPKRNRGRAGTPQTMTDVRTDPPPVRLVAGTETETPSAPNRPAA